MTPKFIQLKPLKILIICSYVSLFRITIDAQYAAKCNAQYGMILKKMCSGAHACVGKQVPVYDENSLLAMF